MDDFTKIFENNYDIVYGYIFRQCHDPHLAEEITQQTFYNAFLHIKSFRHECKLSVWLCQIARNELYAHYKKNEKFAEIDMESLSKEDDIPTKLENEELRLFIMEKIHSLKEPYREVFYLRALGELSFREISRILGKPESWVRVTYYRARLQMKEELS